MPNVGAMSVLEDAACDLIAFLFAMASHFWIAVCHSYVSQAVCLDFVHDHENQGWLQEQMDLHNMSMVNNVTTTDCVTRLHQLPQVSAVIQKRASGVFIASIYLRNLPAGLILGVLYGAWGNREGQMLPLMMPGVGCVVTVLLCQISVYVYRGKVAFFLLANFVCSLGGVTVVFTAALHSQLTAMTTPEQRTRRMSRLVGCSTVGKLLGFTLAGVLQGWYSTSVVLCVPSTCWTLCVIIVFFCVKDVTSTGRYKRGRAETPENISVTTRKPVTTSLSEQGPQRLEEQCIERKRGNDSNSRHKQGIRDQTIKQVSMSKKNTDIVLSHGRTDSPNLIVTLDMDERKPLLANEPVPGSAPHSGDILHQGSRRWRLSEFPCIKAFRDSVRTVCRPRHGHQRFVVIGSVLAIALYSGCDIGDESLLALFTQRPPLSWSASIYSYSMAIKQVITSLSQFVMLPALCYLLRLSDFTAASLGLLFLTVRTVVVGFCSHTWMVLVCEAGSGLGNFLMPAVSSGLSKAVGDDEVGKIFASSAAVNALFRCLITTVLPGIYAASLDWAPFLAFLCETMVYMAMVVLLLALGSAVRPPPPTS